MKKSLFITATLLTAAITATYTYAAPNTRQYHMFEQMDVNNDGLISKSEATCRLADNFDKRDRDGDGFLSIDELPNKRRHHKGMPFAKIDTDNDGKVSREEMIQHFDKLDTNNDGFVTRDDLPKNGRYNGKYNKGAGFTTMDTNNDGQLSKDEAQGCLADNFNRLDSNEDGLLSKEELTQRGNGR